MYVWPCHQSPWQCQWCAQMHTKAALPKWARTWLGNWTFQTYLHHLLYVSFGIHGGLGQKRRVLLRGHMKLTVEGVLPDLLTSSQLVTTLCSTGHFRSGYLSCSGPRHPCRDLSVPCLPWCPGGRGQGDGAVKRQTGQASSGAWAHVSFYINKPFGVPFQRTWVV